MSLKKILLFLVLMALAVSGCDRDDQRPIAPTGGGSPLQAENEIRLLQSILKEDPKNLSALIRLGNATMDSGRFPEAIDAYSRALAIDPSNTNVRVDMGVCYRRLGRSDRAVEEFKKALEVDPRHAFAHMNLGVVMAYDLGRTQEAIGEFEKYLEVAPNAQNAPQIQQEIERLKSLQSQAK